MRVAVRSEKALEHYVQTQMEKYKVGRFRKDNARAVVANFITFVPQNGRLTIRKILDRLCGRTLGPKLKDHEREARTYLMQNMVFFSKGKKYHVKRKPPSDYLINMGFARTLIAFDTRVKNVFEQLFGIKVTEQNYEPIEDCFLTQIYSKLRVTPSEFDRIIFQHYDEIRTWGLPRNPPG